MKTCAACGALMVPKLVGRGNERESPAIFQRRKYCDRACMAKAMHKPDEQLTRGHLNKKRAHQFLKASCESCGTEQRLSVHHEDRNWRNNDLLNVRTLCASCHTSLHHSRGDISPQREKPPCKYCGKPSYRSGLCNTCRGRIRRRGDPSMSRAAWLAWLNSPEGNRLWRASHKPAP